MTLHPILAALRKHKAGAFLIGLQIALTLAIVCNIVFYVAQQVQKIQRPTGLDENNLFLVTQSFVGAPGGDAPAAVEQRDALQLTDLATLRGLPDVADASAVSSLPLLRSGNTVQVALKPDQAHGMATANWFAGDQQVLKTLGLRLIAGRGFTDADVIHRASGGKRWPAVVIVTKALADKLFPAGDALGKPIYLDGAGSPCTIVGVVGAMLTAFPDSTGAWVGRSVLAPLRYDDADTLYAVRAKPGRLQAAMHSARKALFASNPLRVIQSDGRYSQSGIHSFAELRVMGYAVDRFMVQVLTVVCLILLAVTAVGMTGLTSFWVAQRHKQIGIRRALGATRTNILHYFQVENLLIAGGGCVAGIVLAVGINLALMRVFAMDRMPVWYVIVGVLVVLALGQLAVFAPARRASNVPPVVATRSV
ncbi:MAG TPA: ABC transporter permease [Rhodanobacteraceae bacterium]|nr:ABC transporter permease [Rhodanobacteraceae bacterium]